jgi:hypothetical protein
MTLKVVGAGVGRTGTHSLKFALEQLLGAPCYHMMELLEHQEHLPAWEQAIDGTLRDWDTIFGGYAAAVDWPASGFWPELSNAYPDAIVLLSVRETDGWWKSASSTIWEVMKRGAPPDDAFMQRWLADVKRMLTERFSPDWQDEAAAKAAYVAHNARVRAEVPKDRLVEWHPGDGWEPICTALGLAVPDTPFPHVNTTDEFRLMTGLDAAPAQ